jgi:ABC-type transport system involved in multi-copper enzyme maturation permease subunit
MLPGPVFIHQLLVGARRRRSYALRTALGLFLLYSMIQSTDDWIFQFSQAGDKREFTPGELAHIGMRLFYGVILIQGVVILLLTPALVAGTIAEDRERKVLPYLLASPLSGAEIVLGKLGARLLNLIMLLAVGLPVVSIALFLGGVDPAALWLWYGCSFTTLYLLAAISIFVSTHAPRPRDAILYTFCIELIWLLLPVVEWLCRWAGGTLGGIALATRPVAHWLIDSSPVVLFDSSQSWWSGRGSVFTDLLWLTGLQLIQGSLLLAWSTLRLRPVEQGSRLRGLRWLNKQHAARPHRLFARRPCGNAPMIWKECSGSLSSQSVLRTVWLFGLVAATVGGLVYLVYRLGVPAYRELLDYGYGSTGNQSARDMFNVAVRALTAPCYILMALMLGAGAATGFTMEREKDTWITLAATPMESQEVLTGKILGALWRIRGLALVLLLLWLLGLICGAVHPLGFLLAIVSTSIYLAFIAVLGTYLSLRSKSSVLAIATTIASLVFLNGGYLFCCLPLIIGPENLLLRAGITPMMVTAAPFTFTDLEEFLRPRNEDFGPRRIHLVLTVGLSLVAYGLSTYGLIHACLNRFGIVVDRPRRSDASVGKRLSEEGIRFDDQEEDEAGRDGVFFVEHPGENKIRQSGSGDDSSPNSNPR